MAFYFVANIEELPPGEVKRITIAHKEILVANVDGRTYAIDERCGHMNGPLSMGKLYGTQIECPLHKARFDLATGKCVVKPHIGGVEGIFLATTGIGDAVAKIDTHDLSTYLTRIEQNRVEVEIP